MKPLTKPSAQVTVLPPEASTGKRLVAEACARYYMTKKELAQALEVPVSAISGKRIALAVEERLEALLQEDHGALEGVDDMLEASQVALHEEHRKQLARHERGLERGEKEMERMPVRYMRALHRLARLRKVIAALDGDDVVQVEELAHQENKLMNAVMRNNLAAQYRLRIKVRLHQEALELLQEELDLYGLREELALQKDTGPVTLEGNADGLDVLQESVALMGISTEELAAMEVPALAEQPAPNPAGEVVEETRQQRRKRERQEAKAAERAAKAQKLAVTKG